MDPAVSCRGTKSWYQSVVAYMHPTALFLRDELNLNQIQRRNVATQEGSSTFSSFSVEKIERKNVMQQLACTPFTTSRHCARKSTCSAAAGWGPRDRPPAPEARADVEVAYTPETAVARRFERAAARPRPTRARRVPRSSLSGAITLTLLIIARSPAPWRPPPLHREETRRAVTHP